LAPETILLELHRFLERQQINILGQLLHRSFPSEQLAVFIGQVLSQVPILIIFDNFETQLSFHEGKHHIDDPDLKVFLEMLVKTTGQCSCFLFTSRYIFDIEEKRVGPVRYLALNDLSRPEAIWLMQNLPHLSAVSFGEQLEVFEVFGGHPYGLVTLDRHCGQKSLWGALKDAREIHQELREFLAIEINYTELTEKSRELLNRLAAFRKPVEWEAVHWVIGKPIDESAEFLKQLDRQIMPAELQNLSDEELIRLIKQSLPEKRQAKDVDEPVRELVDWGLLTPIEKEGEAGLLAVHSLVRDFCRDKCKHTWKQYLVDAAGYYTNQSEGMEQDRKTPGIVKEEIEAAELLMEAGEFEPAASIIIAVTPLLDRWGLGRLAESLNRQLMPVVKKETQSGLIHDLGNLLQKRGDYPSALEQYEKSLKIKEELGDRAGVAISLNQVGIIHKNRGNYPTAMELYEKSQKIEEELGNLAGVAHSLNNIGAIHRDHGDYPAALEQYEKSLKIFEELGDRDGVAISHGQLGQLSRETNKYPEAFEHFLTALNIFSELQSPYAKEAIKDLIQLRTQWGAKHFDAAWKERTGEEVPEWLIGEIGEWR
jgi:tetratricopeptide (TPR) repeat protein